MTKEHFIFGLAACGCLLKDGKTWYEHNELIKCFEDLGLFEQEPILDKIRAEILEEKECAYADFERYKVEYLGQDWEDALDSLPQDDFRYGMERAIELIDKYKAESEKA